MPIKNSFLSRHGRIVVSLWLALGTAFEMRRRYGGRVDCAWRIHRRAIRL